jgi:dTDP-glucose 4,6-dehydratase
MKIVITGGSGFIGTNLVNFLSEKKYKLLNIDKVGYASTPEKFKIIKNKKNYSFSKLDICKYQKLEVRLKKFKPDLIINLAANSHVDKSITSPKKFYNENIFITQNILEWLRHNREVKLIHISTDEVYGSIKKSFFNEKSILDPSSPYSASKASTDLLIKSYTKTYNLKSCILRFCNNFGPYQFTEKFIPTIISRIFENKSIPVYGKGKNVREWIHVDDTCRAIERFILKFKNDEIYNIGSNYCYNNITVVKNILKMFSEKKSCKIVYVRDRAAHDFRYALDSNKVKKFQKFKTKVSFISGIKNTINWYESNKTWINNTKKKYQGQRQG